MNDSFSKLAKKIRQNKINKREIRNIKNEIIDNKVLKIIKTDMAIRIQKIIRGFLYRKKYYTFLDEINTETIINYLYEQKLNRITTNYKQIISNHIFNYILYNREEKEKMNKQKLESIDLIKSVLRGMIFRKNFNKEISSFKDIKNKIEKYILGYKIKLILRSNNIQSLLIDIANIKYSLNNIDKNEPNNHKIKELKTKLTKNINLFYFTFYQMKENSNWISQTKIKEPWIKKYLSIINKDIENDKSNGLFKKKSIYSNQKKIRRLKENNSKSNDVKKDALRSVEYRGNSKSNTISYDKDMNNINTEKGFVNTEVNYYNNDSSKENKINKDTNNEDKSDKNYDFNFYDSESEELDENVNKKYLHKGTEIYKNKNSKNEIKKNKTFRDEDLKPEINDEEEEEKEKGKKMRSNIAKRYKSKKGEEINNQSKSQEIKEKEEENNNKDENEKDITDFSQKEENQKEKEKEENEEENNKIDLEIENEIVNKPKKLNKYQLREERPIKPLTNKNFMENENPFGLKRESSENISENQNLNLDPNNKNKSMEKRILSSSRAINRALVNDNRKEKNKKKNISETEKEETIKTQEKTDLSHEEPPVSNKYIEYDNRPCGGGSKNIAMYDFEKYDDSLPPPQKKLDRNERPLVGKKIDYNQMFGEDGNEFEGDPFGGAKQFESTNKDKIKNTNLHKSSNIKRKPVYDARKAIEEAKQKEAKEGKKEKPSAFREFLREMKKISAEEKANHNETNANVDNLKNDKKSKNNIKNNANKNNKNKSGNNSESNAIDNKIEKNKSDKSIDPDERSIKKNIKKQSGGEKNNLNKEKNKENDDNNELINNDNNAINMDDKENTLKKKHRGSVMETKEIALRRKLHELEKAPAPVLNIKGIKSRIECWGNSNDKRNKNNNPISQNKPKENPKSRDDKKFKTNKANEQKLISNFINNKKLKENPLSDSNMNIYNNNLKINNSVSSNNIPKISKNMEEKIAKYVDKKLMQLNLQIEEIDELFNFESYFKEKENKMKQYINLPYIKESFDFVSNFSNEDYDERMEQIEKKYKDLK